MALKSLIVAALAAAQLPPGTAEGVDCVVARTPAADRLAIADGALSESGAPPGAAEAEGRYGDSLAVCAQLHGWDDPQMLRVSTLGIASMVREVARARLAGAGIDDRALDLWFDRQSEGFRTSAFHSLDETELDAAIATLPGNVVPADLMDAHAGLIGGYLAMRVLAVRVERGLPVD